MRVTALGYEPRSLTHLATDHSPLAIELQHRSYELDVTVVSGNISIHRTPAQKMRDWFRYTFRRRGLKKDN